VAKVKFKFSAEKISFEFEGDQDTGFGVNRSMSHMFGPMVEPQHRVIDVTPEHSVAALPAPATHRRRHRTNPKPATNGQHSDAAAPSNGSSVAPRVVRQRRPQGSSFRDQMYVLIREGYLGRRRTASEIEAELSRRGHHFDPKNIASDLLWFVQKEYLSRDRNQDGKYAYVKGRNNDFPGSQGRS
jgi:hypothetical protein